MAERVVFTGIGVVSPIGCKKETFWKNALRGFIGFGPQKIRELGRELDTVGAEVKDFGPDGEVLPYDPSKFIPAKKMRDIPLQAQYSMGAGFQAGQDADIFIPHQETQQNGRRLTVYDWKHYGQTEVGAVIATAVGGATQCADALFRMISDKRIPPTAIDLINPNRSSDVFGFVAGARGQTLTPTIACAGGIGAAQIAAFLLRGGNLKGVFAGGTEAVGNLIGNASYQAMGAIPKGENVDDFAHPFEQDDKGNYVGKGTAIGNGAGVTFMETLRNALERKAPRIYGELIAVAANTYYNEEQRARTNPQGIIAAMRQVMIDGQIQPEQIDLIVDHAPGTISDESELQAIRALFGHRKDLNKLLITSPKTWVAHMQGAAAAIGIITALLAMRDGIVPPTTRLNNPKNLGLNLVPNVAQEHEVNYAIVDGFGFGGVNYCALIKKYNPKEETFFGKAKSLYRRYQARRYWKSQQTPLEQAA